MVHALRGHDEKAETTYADFRNEVLVHRFIQLMQLDVPPVAKISVPNFRPPVVPAQAGTQSLPPCSGQAGGERSYASWS